MSKQIIVKIQEPLATNAEIPVCLVYNKDRSVMFEAPFEQVAILFEEDDLKIYYKVKIVNNIMHTLHRVKDQDW